MNIKRLAMIVAFNEDRAIGKSGKLPWHYKEDMKHFRKLTNGHVVIMGRKTFESIGKALPKRTNYVLTRDSEFVANKVTTFDNPEDALESAWEVDNMPFIIGGSSLYSEYFPFATDLFLTKIEHKVVNADTFLEEWDLKDFECKDVSMIKNMTFAHMSLKDY